MLPLFLCQMSAGDGSYTFQQQQQQEQRQQQDRLPLSCVIKFNQLYCSEAGASYPSDGINKYLDDNKVRIVTAGEISDLTLQALLRRMFGELQERRTVTQTSVTIVTSFSQTR